ncbi:hypothetical protein GGR52DRAFT_183223 [Hypoxylon sp. FL1284]|nr:hypothetical protein GGR52DRAFT_183223 [Hypoxylon sp. FL1284]
MFSLSNTMESNSAAVTFSWLTTPYALLSHIISYSLGQIKIIFGSYEKQPPEIVLPNQRFQRCLDEHQKLVSLWRESQLEPTVFISINVHYGGLECSEITDINISIWQFQSQISDESETDSYHWRIAETLSLSNHHLPADPEMFTFGTTEVIQEAEIALRFDDIFQPLMDQFSKVVIVGYGIPAVIRFFVKYWRPPESATLLDTQMIWQIQHRILGPIGLEEALNETSDTRFG